MIPAFLLPENTVRESGQGPDLPLEAHRHQPVLLTLGINRILEQESLEVSICGSADGTAWMPVAAFAPKSYCGTYSLLADLSRYPEINRIRAQWKMSRWDQGRQKPLFGFYVYVEEPRMHVAGAA